MAADTAITISARLPSGKPVSQILTGAKKLQKISYLNAGVSFWGLASLPRTGAPTELWLEDFIKRHNNLSSLDEFAQALTKESQTVVGQLQQPLGFHLAGYIAHGDQLLPTFYHIRNVDGNFVNDYQFHDFIIGQDYPPAPIGNDRHLTRNGEYGLYAIMSRLSELALQAAKGLNITVPYPSLEGRMGYLAAWIKFVSALYESSQQQVTISSNVSTFGDHAGWASHLFPRLERLVAGGHLQQFER